MVDQRLQHLAKESKTKTKETPVTEKTTRASQKKVSKSSEE